jgi:hypothetical protein
MASIQVSYSLLVQWRELQLVGAVAACMCGNHNQWGCDMPLAWHRQPTGFEHPCCANVDGQQPHGCIAESATPQKNGPAESFLERNR